MIKRFGLGDEKTQKSAIYIPIISAKNLRYNTNHRLLYLEKKVHEKIRSQKAPCIFKKFD